MSLSNLDTFFDEMRIVFTENPHLIGLLPTVVIVIGAIILSLGVRRGETRVEEFNVTSNYYSGVLVVINYILEPFAAIFFVKFIIENWVPIFFDQLWTFITDILLPCVLLIVELSLLLLVQWSKEQIRDKRNSLSNFKNTKENNNEENNQLTWLKNLCKNRLRSWFVPGTLILILYSYYKLNVPPEIMLPSFILAVLTFINFVICEGYQEIRYTEAILHLKNDPDVEGIILKSGSYINILTKDGTYLINNDDVRIIEKSKNSKKLCCDYFTLVHEKLTSLFRKNRAISKKTDTIISQ